MTINSEAIDALTAAIQSLLPDVADPALQPSVIINPTRISPTGIGGYVGPNEDPAGDIVGRRLDATAFVTVKADNLDGLEAAVGDAIRGLMGVERETLRQHGILRISLDQMGERIVTTSGDGPGANAKRELTLAVLFEYLKLPEEGSGIIDEIPLNISVGETGATPRIILAAGFSEASLGWFEVVDDPVVTQNAPSSWQFNAVERRIEQLSNIRGGSQGANVNKPGTYLVLRTAFGRPPVQDFDMRVVLSSDDRDGIGIVFRWQDVDNFYFFLMHERRNFRALGRKVGGTFANLSTPAFDNAQSFAVGQTQTVRVTAEGPVFRVFMDDELVLQGQDSAIPGPGRVGFICHANNRAFFYRLELVQLLAP